MDLFDIAVARKLSGGGGGGSSVTVEPLTATENRVYTAPSGTAYSPVTVNVSGGSSDFSTAEVTITSDINTTVIVPCAFDENDESSSFGSAGVVADTPLTITVILYKGTAILYCEDANSFEVTGNIVDDYGDIYIYGNGTITIS